MQRRLLDPRVEVPFHPPRWGCLALDLVGKLLYLSSLQRDFARCVRGPARWRKRGLLGLTGKGIASSITAMIRITAV